MSLRWTEEDLEAYRQRQGKQVEGTSSVTASPCHLPRRGKAVEMVPTEDEEQIALFEWAARMTGKMPELEWLYHIPNGGSRGPAEAGRFRAMGVRRGVPDVALDVARGGYHGLRIEMKRARGGKTSPDQDRWIAHLRAEGYRAEVCHGWTAAARVIEEYMAGGGDISKANERPRMSAGGRDTLETEQI